MKQLIFILICTLTIVYGQQKLKYKEPNDKNDAALAWAEFVQEFAPTYKGSDIVFRQKVFFDNFQNIVDFNNKNNGMKYGINQFSDLSNEEFSALPMFNSQLQAQQPVEQYTVTASAQQLVGIAASIDWRTSGVVTPVKNQGSCGSCYAFAASATLESLYKIKGGALTNFSEQQIVDCSSSYGNQGCKGGWYGYVYKYTKKSGIESSTAYPYKAVLQKCAYKSTQVVFKNTGYIDVVKNSSTQLQAAVALQPVAVAIQANTPIFQYYSSGILNDNGCYNGTINHAVTIVGYNQDPTTLQNYWIVKNSWNTWWGELGYVRIAFDPTVTNTLGICGINYWPSYPV